MQFLRAMQKNKNKKTKNTIFGQRQFIKKRMNL